MKMVRVKPALITVVVVFLTLSFVIGGCSSEASRHDATPENYDLVQHVSPDGDWKCYLAGDAEAAPEDIRKSVENGLSIIAKDTEIELWAAGRSDTTTFIVRFTGSGIESLKEQTNGSKSEYADLLTKLGAITLSTNLYYRPVYWEESLAVYAPEDKPTPTRGFYVECELVNNTNDKDVISTSFGGIGTYSDNAYYFVVTVGDNSSKDRMVNNSFEVIPDNGFTPKENADEQDVPEGAIPWQEASRHIGETVTIYGPVADAEFADTSSGQPTFIDLGAAYPDKNRVSMVVWGEDRDAFPEAPESMYAGCTICVTGEIYIYNDVCNIKVTSPSQVQVM